MEENFRITQVGAHFSAVLYTVTPGQGEGNSVVANGFAPPIHKRMPRVVADGLAGNLSGTALQWSLQ